MRCLPRQYKRGLALIAALAGAAAMLAVLLVVRETSVVDAAPPVSGNSLSFGVVTAIFTPTQDVTALALTDLDGDAFPDLVFAAESEVWIAAATGLTFTGWLTPVLVGTAGARVNDLVAADLDRDTYPDLVVFSGGGAGGEVRLWRNPGDPFGIAWSEGGAIAQSAVVTFSSGTVADLDGDGALDVVAGGSDGLIYLWRNPMFLGDSFTNAWGNPVQLTGGSGPVWAVQVADLNHDGRPDVVATAGSGLRVWENPGDPFTTTWATSFTLSGQGSALRSLFVADLNQDGRPDVVGGDELGYLLAWVNPSTPGLPLDGNWPSPVQLGSLGEAMLALSGGDFDHDGAIDLVAGGGGASHTVRAWRNSGSLSEVWDSLTLGTRSGAVYALLAADADGDGDLDVLCGSDAADTPQVVWWPNALIHHLAFFPETELAVGYSSSDVEALVQGDLNRDGWPDLVMGTAAGEIVILENDGTPTDGAWPAHPVGTGSAVLSLALADLDGDGDLEIISGHTSPPRLLAWENQGSSLDGPWGSSEIGDPGAAVGALAVADLDGDGWPDLVSGTGEHGDDPSPHHKVTIWRNDGSPFDAAWPFTDTAVFTYSVNAVAVGDLDGDGWPDIVAGTDHAPPLGDADHPVPRDQWPNVYELFALRNPGDPFAAPWLKVIVGRDPATVTLGPEEDPSHYHGYWGAAVFDVKLADFDRDGDLDIATADHIEADYQVKIWENDGTPFDGQPETFHWTWQPTAVWYGQPPSPPWMGGSALTVDVADFNNDGWLDLVAGITGGWLRVWFEDTGTPCGEYITDTHWVMNTIAHSYKDIKAIVVADYDRDGDPDVAAGSELVSGPEVVLWPNWSGSVSEVTEPTGESPLQHKEVDDLLHIRVTNNGHPDEESVRLIRWRVRFTESDGSPMSQTRANALVDRLWVYRDTGNRRWSLSDTPVLTVTDLVLDADGYQLLEFDPSDPLAVVPADSAVSYFIVVQIADGAMYQTPNAFQVWFDADADSLVQGMNSRASVSIADTDPVGSGVIEAVGPPTHVLIEKAPDGTGDEVEDWAVASGYSIDFYAVGRDDLEHFVEPEAVTWTLATLSGGVVPGDLVPSADGTSARLYGHLTGTARISITHTTLGTDTTGIITVAPAPAQMALEADPAEVTADGVSTTTLRATLWDTLGDLVVDGVPVTFTIVSGSKLGSLPASPYVAETISGQATAVFTASTKTGQVAIVASTGGLAQQITITLKPGPLAAFQIGGNTSFVYAGEQLFWGPTVTALDPFGNVKTDYLGSVYFLSTDPWATFSYTVDAPYTFTVEDQGSHHFDGAGFVLGKVGMQVITVTDGTISAATDPIEVRPGLAVGSIELTLSSQVITAGQSITCTVEAFDAYGNSKGDWTPWCKYTISSQARGHWDGNVYTSERMGTWTIVASTRVNPSRSDSATLTVLPIAKVYLPLVLREY